VEPTFESTEQGRLSELATTVNEARTARLREGFQFTSPAKEHLRRHLAGRDGVRLAAGEGESAVEDGGEARRWLSGGERKKGPIHDYALEHAFRFASLFGKFTSVLTRTTTAPGR
jgi:hypothetical protein